jgi:TM2 domain-containing membrane protein YozV
MSGNHNLGSVLLLLLFFGPLGIDRLFLGKTGQGVAMLITSLLIIGLPVTLTIAFISAIMVNVSIWTGSKTCWAYSNVKFNRVTTFDKVVSVVFIALFLASITLCGVSPLLH